MKSYACIRLDSFKSCSLCGNSTRSLNYLSDSSAPICDECLRSKPGYTQCKYLLRVPAAVTGKIREVMKVHPHSAWYLFGSTVGTTHKMMVADACVPWSYDSLGRPRFDSKASMKQVLAQRSECIATLVSVPSLKQPPTAGNLACLKLTNSPLVCLVDCDEPEITYGRMTSEGTSEGVIVVLEGS